VSQAVSRGGGLPPDAFAPLGLVALATIHLDLADEALAAAYPPETAPHLAPWAHAHVLLRRALLELHNMLSPPPPVSRDGKKL
jgi:hypothetical protein